jgi:serine O-acetyltransferase
MLMDNEARDAVAVRRAGPAAAPQAARTARLREVARRLAAPAAERLAAGTGALAPSRREVALLCEALFDALVPGSYPAADGSGRGDSAEALARLHARACALLRAVAPGHGQAAERFALELVEALPDAQAALVEDVRAGYAGDPAAASMLEVAVCYPAIVAIAIHRLAHRLHARGAALLPRMMAEWAHGLTGVDIHPGARIGRRFFIDHGTGVVIGGTAVLGDDVQLYQGVTLGTLSFARDASGAMVRGGKRHPTIGNGVTIYAGAMVLGGATTVGDGAVIGAATVVTADVPAGAVVCRGRREC